MACLTGESALSGLAGVTVIQRLNDPPSVSVKMSNEAMPEAGLLSGPFGSEPPTDTLKVVDVVAVGREPTVLTGGVVSISHEVESEPEPADSLVSLIPPALTDQT